MAEGGSRGRGEREDGMEERIGRGGEWAIDVAYQ